ncbi:OmpA family protein [Lewinella sp. W8]|uniref:OmpA family protein n=1 Tax=Lewinella sp. W8 TaxID=2528208 RepID=UPI0010683484|nr:OmpA family protein [Lewinella sp. W8]MTB52734.1 OmpA family protein [Lewinella sp. W8]
MLTFSRRNSPMDGKIALPLLLLFWSSLALAQGTLLNQAGNSDIEIENCARINDGEVQFGPALYGDDLVFVTRPRRGNVDPATGKTFFELFRAPLNPDGAPGYPKPFSVELNSNYNEGPVSFSNDDRVIYFTRTLLSGGTTIEDPSGTANLGVYSAFRAEYDWAAVRALPFNGANFSNQHPSVTANGRRIFFASDRNGGYGGYDLFFSDFRDGRWGPAINLGPEINTEGNEAFPFIHPSGRLFFASNGHGATPDYDLFMMDLSQRRWGKLIRLPAPLNSSADEVGLCLTADGRRAYLVSNRAGGKGQDDIYLIRMPRGLATLEGASVDGETLTIYDGATSQRVAGAQVWLCEVDPAGRLPADFYSFELRETVGAGEILPVEKAIGSTGAIPLRSDQEGSLRLELNRGKTYEVQVLKPGFAPQRLRFLYTEEGPSRPLVVTLSPSDCVTVSGRVRLEGSAGAEGVAVQFRPENCPGASLNTTTDLTGYYQLCLPPNCNYLISAGGNGYATVSDRLPATAFGNASAPEVNLETQTAGNVRRRSGDLLSATLPLPGVSYFGNTAVLREDESRDINLLMRLLTDRPDLKMEIVVHTDGPGPEQTLMQLGQQRGDALRQALIRRGINDRRLRVLPVGRQYRVRECSSCTPEDYAANNRLEVRVID